MFNRGRGRYFGGPPRRGLGVCVPADILTKFSSEDQKKYRCYHILIWVFLPLMFILFFAGILSTVLTFGFSSFSFPLIVVFIPFYFLCFFGIGGGCFGLNFLLKKNIEKFPILPGYDNAGVVVLPPQHMAVSVGAPYQPNAAGYGQPGYGAPPMGYGPPGPAYGYGAPGPYVAPMTQYGAASNPNNGSSEPPSYQTATSDQQDTKRM